MGLINFTSKTDDFYGFKRHIFDFEGHEAWIVEPHEAAAGNPWTWCMEWPSAFVMRTGAPELLARGFHHVFVKADGYGCDADLRMFEHYHSFLNRLGLAERPGLIGMSLGGFYSVRYAALDPTRVACMYLDAPLCSFKGYYRFEQIRGLFGLESADNVENDPQMPVNMTRRIASIPILLLYGADDYVLSPADNAELLIQRLRENGAEPTVIRRLSWGHHPHGLDDPSQIVGLMLRYAGIAQ